MTARCQGRSGPKTPGGPLVSARPRAVKRVSARLAKSLSWKAVTRIRDIRLWAALSLLLACLGLSCQSDEPGPGPGNEPVCRLQVERLEFGTLVADGSFSDQSFTLWNGGGGVLAGAVTIEGSRFTLVSGGGSYSLGPGELRTVVVRYSPDAPGDHSGSVQLGTACGEIQCLGRAQAPALCAVEPTTLDFGGVGLSDSAEKTFLITNESTTSSLSGEVSESCPAYEIVSGGGPFSLPPTLSLEVRVRFAPVAVGAAPCQIAIQTNGEVGAAVCSAVACTGSGLAGPVCTIEPTTLEFGTVAAGATADRTFTIRNDGGGLLAGTIAAPCEAYSITEGGGDFSLAAGVSRAVTVRFAPTTAGALSCNVETGVLGCAPVACSGTGILPPSCVVEPASLDFGSVRLGESGERSFTIRNSGGGTLAGRVRESCDPFVVVAGSGSFSLSAEQTRTVTIRFLPVEGGLASCAVETGLLECPAVACAGLGEAPPTCRVTPTTLDFGGVAIGAATELAFSIQNVGGGTLDGSVPAACGAFVVVTGAGPYSLGAGAKRLVTVRFAPSVAGPESCFLDSGHDGCADVSLNGTGTLGPACSVIPSELDFGVVTVGSSALLAFTLRNAGGGELVGTIPSQCGAFEVVAGGGSYALGAGQSRTVTVRFAPSTAGASSCDLELGPVACAISLAGGGEAAPVCQLEPTSLDFGALLLGTSADRTVTVRNAGGGLLSGSLGGGCSDFSILDGGSEIRLGPGESQVMTVRFAPTELGVRDCDLEGDGICAAIPLHGSGTTPALCAIDPPSLNFGSVEIGGSRKLSFEIKNHGGLPLSGNLTESCDDFSIVSGGGSFSLDPEGVLTVVVRFEPAVAETAICSIATGMEECPAVGAAGKGRNPPRCEVNPALIDFGPVPAGQSAESSFTIRNVGDGVLTGSVAEACEAFSITSGGGDYALGAGELRTVNVRFEPVEEGPASCAVTLGPSGEGRCESVTLQGSGLPEADCIVTPTTLDFGTLEVGETADLEFTIENTGGSPLSGNVTEGCAAFSIVSNGGAFTLESNTTRTVVIRFAPTTAGAQNCTIETGTALCSDVSASGTGESSPLCSVNPTSLSFGLVTLGQTVDRTFTIQNTGGGSLPIDVTESCNAYSIVSGGGPGTLTGNETRSVTVRFAPALVGSQNCVIETGSAVCVDVSCNGSGDPPPACSIVPSSLDFGNVLVGSSLDKSFTITNAGGGTLTGTVAESCTPYAFVSGGGSFALGPNQSRVVVVRFAPTSTGSQPCTIDTGTSACADVNCTGTGEPVPVCQVTPTSLDFGIVPVGNTADRTFTIKNTGGGTLSGTISESCPAYGVVAGGGSYSLTANQTRTVTVRFAPTGSGNQACSIETGAAICADVSCIGNGDPLPVCEVAPTSLDFGEVTVGQFAEKTFTIQNTGGGTLSGTISESCAPYSLVSGGGAYSLTANQSRTVTVRFTPTGAGAAPCVIETGSAACADVTCAGTGALAPACDVNPTALDFGTVPIGEASERSFTIQNIGGGVLSGTVSESCDAYSFVSGGGAYSLGAGESQQVTVRFEPTTSGSQPCTIETELAACSDVSCTAEGTEVTPLCVVTPELLEFGAVVIGQFAELSFTIENQGGGTVSGDVSLSCPGYTIESGAGAFALGAGESRVVSIRFTPLSPGQADCTVLLGTQDCPDVSCTAEGVLSFFFHIKPLIQSDCASCHDGNQAVDLTIYEQASKRTNQDDPPQSLLLLKPSGDNPTGHGDGNVTVDGWRVNEPIYLTVLTWIQQGLVP